MTEPHTFTGESARRIAKAVRTVEANDPLYTGPKRRRRYQHVRKPFWAQITGSAAISGASNRWKYSWFEVERTATGFQTKGGGRSGTTSERFAINSIEANNDDSNIEGNSVDLSGQIFTDNSGLELQAVRGTPVVRMWLEYDVDGNPAYTFEYVNAIDGECAA